MSLLQSGLVRALGLLTSVFALAPFAPADVLVVNHNGTAPFTTIQAAVNAAVDGDVILVKPRTGRYAAFTIANKALTVVGDPSGTQTVNVDSPVVVHSVAATRTVVLANLVIGQYIGNTAHPAVSGLHVAGVDGRLRVHGCTIRAVNGGWMPIDVGYPGYGQGSPGGAGAWIENSSGGIAFEACTITGGWGGMMGGTGASPGGQGGHGVSAGDARVVLYDCTLRGGRGGDGSFHGGDAGHGMVTRTAIPPSQLMASNTRFEGGAGGIAEDLGCFNCGPGGDGGHGLVVEAGALAWQLESTYAGGPGGPANSSWPDGVPGQGLVNNGSMSTFQVSKVVLAAPAIVREQTAMDFTFAGEPGDEIFLARSKRTSFIGLASWRGFFLAKPVGLNMEEVVPTPVATIPGSGQVTVSVRPPELLPGTNGRTVFYQAYRRSPSGSITLGSFAAVTVVAAGF